MIPPKLGCSIKIDADLIKVPVIGTCIEIGISQWFMISEIGNIMCGIIYLLYW